MHLQYLFGTQNNETPRKVKIAKAGASCVPPHRPAAAAMGAVRGIACLDMVEDRTRNRAVGVGIMFALFLVVFTDLVRLVRLGPPRPPHARGARSGAERRARGAQRCPASPVSLAHPPRRPPSSTVEHR